MAICGERDDEAVGSVDLQNFCELINKYPTQMNLFMPLPSRPEGDVPKFFYSVCKRRANFKATHFSNTSCSAMIFEVLTVMLIEIILVDMKSGKSLSTFLRNMLLLSSNRILVDLLPNYPVSHLRRPQISYTICSDCLVSGLCLSSSIDNEEISVPGSIYALS